MEYIEKNETTERVYSVYIDREKLKDLLDEIIKKTSYRENGTFTAPYNASFKENVFTFGANLPNGDPMYENIKRIYRYTSDEPYSYHNDSIGVEGTQVTPPKLAFIIEDILSGEEQSIYSFINYPNHQELISIDEKISAANKAVDEISNFNVRDKISALTRLNKHILDKEAQRYFDVELLKKYYSQACLLIELQLVSEKNIKNSGKILLRDHKPLKQDSRKDD